MFLTSLEPHTNLSSRQALPGDKNLGPVWGLCLSPNLLPLIFRGLCSSESSTRNPGDSRLLRSVDRPAALFYLRESQSTHHKLSSPRHSSQALGPQPTLQLGTRQSWSPPPILSDSHGEAQILPTTQGSLHPHPPLRPGD